MAAEHHKSLTDISVNFVLAWVRPFPGVSAVLNEGNFPKTIAWLERFRALVTQKEGRPSKPAIITGKQAAQIISSTGRKLQSVNVDATESFRLHVAKGDIVTVTPEDYGRSHPTKGKLVSLTREEMVIEVAGTMGTVLVHFPRLGYTVKPISSKL
ncbi:hypothetical protein M422DRAFT_22753 [Sphaerobolus stellatus SS14]|nr:hypothetical protein M422DRAFT_22753 [Sphaerobolus stellatus SS14]